MRIVVDDIAASKTGALSVLRDFYDHIVENDRENDWIFVLGDKLLEETENIKVLVRDDIKASRKKRLMFDLKNGAEYFMSLMNHVRSVRKHFTYFNLMYGMQTQPNI